MSWRAAPGPSPAILTDSPTLALALLASNPRGLLGVVTPGILIPLSAAALSRHERVRTAASRGAHPHAGGLREIRAAQGP